MTNEERFIASCEILGEADVRAKLSAGRYSERKASWAIAWLQTIDSGRSDITEADESSRTRDFSGTQNRSVIAKLALLIVVLLAGLTGFLLLR